LEKQQAFSPVGATKRYLASHANHRAGKRNFRGRDWPGKEAVKGAKRRQPAIADAAFAC
jgi:hypothetical protein